MWSQIKIGTENSEGEETDAAVLSAQLKESKAEVELLKHQLQTQTQGKEQEQEQGQRQLEPMQENSSPFQNSNVGSGVSDKDSEEISIWPAICAGGIDYFGLGIVTPLLPYWLFDHDADLTWLGTITTAQYLGVIIGSYLFGKLSDTHGRKAAIEWALLGDVLFFLLTANAFSPVFLTIIRFFTGMATPLTATLAWISDAGKMNPIIVGGYMVSITGIHVLRRQNLDCIFYKI